MKFPDPRFPQAPADGTGAGAGAAETKAQGADTSTSVTSTAGAAAAAASKDGKAQETTTETRPSILDSAGADGKGAKEQGAKGDKDAAAKAATPAPVKVTAPQGVELNKDLLAGFEAIATEKGLKQEVAQDLVNWFGKQEQQRVAADKATVDAWDKSNYQALEKDAEFGGTHLAENTAAVQRAVKKFGGEPMAKFLRDERLDNVPQLAKFLAAVGKAIGEDSSAVGAGAAAAKQPTTPAARHAAFYDSPDAKRARGEG
jgi:hypothetical protein